MTLIWRRPTLLKLAIHLGERQQATGWRRLRVQRSGRDIRVDPRVDAASKSDK
jgi:hypothetical protein